MRKYLLPALLVLFAILSLTTLKSIVPDLLAKQALAFVLAAVLFYFASKLPFTAYLASSKWAYLILNILLLALLLWGKVTRGISAWIILPFGFKFQPSQLALPITALYLSSLFHNSQRFSWRLLIKTLILITLPTMLILLEPDFGTAIVLFLALSSYLLLNRLTWQQVLNLLAIGLVVASCLWLLVFKDYQRQRLLSFFAGQDAQLSSQQESSSSYNARQALIAVGSGQFWGRGIGQGVQSQLRFLPERQTDFIFASFVEEWGFVGALFLLALYAVLCAFLLYSAYLAYLNKQFPQLCYLAALFLMFLLQTFINVGMNMALLPITGITLPLLSYGGSSVLSLFFALGVVQAIVKDLKKGAIQSFY